MSPKQNSFSDFFTGTVESRLKMGRTLCTAIGPQLMQDEDFIESFSTLQDYALSLDHHMETMDMGKSCTLCSAETDSGGCCSLTMAGETDAIQFLMNMLNGVAVHAVRDDGKECSFLGARGCIFTFKPIFCLNYNCKKITSSARTEDLKKLEHLTGKLLVKQYEIETMLLARIGSMT